MNTLIKRANFNRKYILILLLVSLSFAKNTEAVGFSSSLGLMSEKIPITFFDMTGYYSPNHNTEYFATFSYLVFGAGIGIGAKYYLKDRKKTSLFMTGAFTASAVGDSVEAYVGPHVAMGLSISFIKILNRMGFDDFINITINLGGGHVFYGSDDGESGFYPFLNGEMKFDIEF